MWRIVFTVLALTALTPPAVLHASHSSGSDAAADALGSLAGTWLGIVELDDLVPPHVETLQLGADGRVVTEVWVERGGELPGTNPRRTARGRIAVDPSRATVSIADLEMLGPGARLGDNAERLARAQLWFGGSAEWTVARRADVLTLSRLVRVADGRSRPYVRSLYRVDALFARDLIDAIDALGESVGAAGCVIEALHRDAAAWRELRFRIRDMARSHRLDGVARAGAERGGAAVPQAAREELGRTLEGPAAARYKSAIRACQNAGNRAPRSSPDPARPR